MSTRASNFAHRTVAAAFDLGDEHDDDEREDHQEHQRRALAADDLQILEGDIEETHSGPTATDYSAKRSR